MAMIAAAPVAQAAAGRAAAGAAAKKGASKAARPRKAAAKKPAAASGTAGVPTPPPPQQMAADLLRPPGKKAVQNVGRSAGDALRSATLKPPRRLSAKDASGFAFGLVLYAMALSGIKHGPAGVTGWLKAKFVNKPMVR